MPGAHNISDLNKLKEVLKDKYNLDSTIFFQEENKFICINNASLPLLRSIILPYMEPSMLGIFQFNPVSSNNTSISTIDTGGLTKNNLVPVKMYENTDKLKELIIKDNRNRSGVYCWVNKENGNSYVGSSQNLEKRFTQYFNYNHISYPKRNLRIYKALLKYGYSGFRLEILEYCYPEILLEREQFYFDTCNPEYNILKVAI